ncbi:MAG: hypothetical protein U0842_15130 [Candidatus Binatia bacterium]
MQWWTLVTIGEATAFETLDHPELPERLAAIELLRHQPSRETLQAALVARRRQVRVAHVVVQVELASSTHTGWSNSGTRASFCR